MPNTPPPVRASAEPRTCRRASPGSPGWSPGSLRDCAADALGEPVTAFKDKLNYKQPGGAGFSIHQDKVAYPGVGRVMSILVAIDDCSVESGCLWIAGGVDAVLPVDERGVVRADAAEQLDWSVAELAAGDAVCIDGLAPHYSETNRGPTPRRVLVASYAPTSERYTREHYYAQRGDRMRAETERDGCSASAHSPTSTAPRSRPRPQPTTALTDPTTDSSSGSSCGSSRGCAAPSLMHSGHRAVHRCSG